MKGVLSGTVWTAGVLKADQCLFGGVTGDFTNIIKRGVKLLLEFLSVSLSSQKMIRKKTHFYIFQEKTHPVFVLQTNT